jgi:hypothetical protein
MGRFIRGLNRTAGFFEVRTLQEALLLRLNRGIYGWKNAYLCNVYLILQS